jgi:lipid II:glycine glycyltransferase (peptidoglycan interpeptide bridge formation enzyme)
LIGKEGKVIIQHISNDSRELDQWDQFLMSSPRGHYCQLSTYLKSFRPYGFGYHVIIVKHLESDQLIGGIGLLKFGKGPLNVVIAPMGPIIDVGQEEAFASLLSEALSYSRSVGAFLFQLKIPFTEEITDSAILPTITMPTGISPRNGFPFDLMAVPNQMLWIEFENIASDEEWEAHMLARFSSGKRRDIRMSEKNGLSVHRVSEESELKEAYSVIELNGQEQGYSTRPWGEFRSTLIGQVHKGQAVVLVACREGQILGAHYGVLAGRRWSYLMGGTVRTDKDYNVGAFLHWQVMKTARAMGLRGYDLTSMGTSGVSQFKMGFRPTHIKFASPKHFILSHWRFAVVMKIYPALKKYKRTFSRYAKLFFAQGG